MAGVASAHLTPGFPFHLFLTAYQAIFFSSHSLVNNTFDIINLKLISGEEIVDAMGQLEVRAAFLQLLIPGKLRSRAREKHPQL